MVTDVFVAGGGPAGLAAAIAARMKGMRVVVADAAEPPIDKACGEGLMPGSVEALSKLGVHLDSDGSYPFRGICFLGEGAAVSASFPRGTGIGIRRTVLHSLLVERAEAVGVQFLWRSRVTGIRDGFAEVGGRTITCKWTIGADGQNSLVRRWAGLTAVCKESRRYGFRRHYRVAPWSDCVEVHWGPGCQIYVTPVGEAEVGVALVSRDPHLRLEAALTLFPAVARRLAGAVANNQERGAVSVTRRLRRVAEGRVALIGDASGSVDAITGEGLGLAFQQALLLAEALAAERLHTYRQGHRALVRRPALMGSALLLLDRFPMLRRLVLRALDTRTEVFAGLLAAHVGAK